MGARPKSGKGWEELSRALYTFLHILVQFDIFKHEHYFDLNIFNTQKV